MIGGQYVIKRSMNSLKNSYLYRLEWCSILENGGHLEMSAEPKYCKQVSMSPPLQSDRSPLA